MYIIFCAVAADLMLTICYNMLIICYSHANYTVHCANYIVLFSARHELELKSIAIELCQDPENAFIAPPLYCDGVNYTRPSINPFKPELNSKAIGHFHNLLAQISQSSKLTQPE